MSLNNLVFSQIHIDPKLDQYLEAVAKREKISKHDVIQRCIMRGGQEEIADALTPHTGEPHPFFGNTLLHCAKNAQLLERAEFTAKAMESGVVLYKPDPSAPVGVRWIKSE